MSRIARKNFETSFFHIMVQGINKEYIFNKKVYIEKYLNLMFKKMEEYNVQIIAYCIMNNHAHILIYTEKIENMSKAMHYINTLYAQYYNFMEDNRIGHVFRNRYKSEEIKDEIYLINCIKYIHNNPVKAGIVQNLKDYKYSSYLKYENKEWFNKNTFLSEIIDINLVIKEDNNVYDFFIDIDKDKYNDIEEMIFCGIKEFENRNGMLIEEIKKNEKMLLTLVNELKEKYKITQKEILNIIKISKSKFGRIQQKEKMGRLGTVPNLPKGGKNEV